MTKKSITLDVDPTIMEKNMKIVKDNPMEEEINKLFTLGDPYPSKLVKPIPGFCVKTFCKTDSKKVFINICQTTEIPCPRDITNDELMEILNSEDPSSYRVPMSLGEPRTDKDRHGAPATVYDVAINNHFFKKIEKDELFQTFFLTIVFEGLQDKYQFELNIHNYTVLKNRKSMGTLQSHRVQVRDVKNVEEAQRKPLIEEIGGGEKGNTQAVNETEELVYRLRREPPTGEIEKFIAEFQIPPTLPCASLSVCCGADRLAVRGGAGRAELWLPEPRVDADRSDAVLDRNTGILSVTLPVCH